jgi:adenosylmethionine-8-amino-7-oxononanoate transaminase/dethiobiotin synthase
MTSKAFFITGTDTSVGKTIAMLALGVLFKERKIDVGVFKPVQCAGDDAAFLRDALDVDDPINSINPYYAKEPLSPHLAFARRKTAIDRQKIFDCFEMLKSRHDVLLVEGAGGLMVPIMKDYLVADLVRDLDIALIIVARLGLGTINHTLLTVEQARSRGIPIAGIIFSDAGKGSKGVPEKTNPRAIAELSGVPVLGTIPRLKRFEAAAVLRQCRRAIDIAPLCRGTACHAPTAHLAELDRQHVWHPFTQMKDWLADDPLIIERGEGSYLIDTDGKRYLDGVSSLWVNVHGHRKKEIDQAIKDQLNRIAHSTFLGLSNVPAIELAEQLVQIAPKGLKKVFYSDNGSTAVEIGVKMAYQYWQNTGRKTKRTLVHLTNSYHGDTLGSVSVGGIDLFHKVYRGLIFKTIGLPGQGWETVEAYERLLKKKAGSLAALVVEPLIQGAAGMLIWPKGVLKEFRRLSTKYDVMLIADEVATGFGRTGKMFACEHEGVTPDILCLAKGITGGYLPLAATLTTQKIYDGFVFDYKDQKTFFHGHTYTANPLACAAALANLKLFQKDRLLEKLALKIKYLAENLQMFYNLASVGDVRQLGFMAGIELFKDAKTKKPYSWEEKIGVQVCQEARKNGVILRPLGNVIVLMPPLSISKAELAELLDATYRAINVVTNK